MMRDTYVERDAARGRDATFRWLTEEVGGSSRGRCGPAIATT